MAKPLYSNSPLLKEMAHVKIGYMTAFLQDIVKDVKTFTPTETLHAINKCDDFGPATFIAAMARTISAPVPIESGENIRRVAILWITISKQRIRR